MIRSYAILTVTALLSVAASAVFYKLERTGGFGRMEYKRRQLIYGLVFGILSVLGTELGMPVQGVVLNVRDVAPICAGLIFGAPAGIISGLIGGIERYFAVYWGAGTYTRVACTVATIFAGFLSAFLRKFMFEDKKPAWFFGLMIGAITEVFHMLVVFLIHLNEPRQAFIVVEACTIPMIILTAAGAGLALVAVSAISPEKSARDHSQVKISQDFQRWLLICVMVAFVVTCVFARAFLTNVAFSDTDSMLKLNIADVEKNIAEEGMISLQAHNRHVGEEGFIVICDENLNPISGHEGRVSGDNPFAYIIGSGPEMTRIIANVDGTEYACMYRGVGDFYIFALRPLSEVLFSRDMSVYLTIFMEVMVFTVLFIAVYILIRVMIVDNISRVNHSLSEITGGNLNVVVNVTSNQEFASLSNDINSTVDTLKRYIAEAAARIDRELEYAKEIQYSSLPHVFPPFPGRSEFEIWAGMYTAKEVGGDFYDFYFVDDNKLAFLVADVSGKGIPAALFMMRAKTMLKNMASSGMDVDEVFTVVNNNLCENNEADMFVTCWMGILNTDTGVVRYADAGHNPPLVKHAAGPTSNFEFLKSRKGLVLGGMEGVKYHANEFTMCPGDVIFLYTDGVPEATDAHDELYGDERMKGAINEVAGSGQISCEDICHRVKAGVDAFVGDAPQFDDITMLCMRYAGR